MIPAIVFQNESTLVTPEDIILALDKWLLPSYPSMSTANPMSTKLECFGILHSMYMAGRLHVRIRPSEVEKAVDAFMEDRLWVPRETLQSLTVLPKQRPESWMIQATIYLVAKSMLLATKEVFSIYFNLIKMFYQTKYYALKPEQEVRIPVSPHERKPATVTLLKKDN